MVKRITIDERLLELKRLIEMPRWSYTLSIDGRFSPSDVVPHSTAIKYSCQKLFEAGYLTRDASPGRWGYFYKFTEAGKKRLGG